MTDQEDATDGVDTEALETFVGYASDHPEAIQFGLGARATYEGTCAHSLATIDSYELGGETVSRKTRSYTIPYGGWREVLETAGWVGPTDRLEPTEVALSALAACINVAISLQAVAHGAEITDLRTKVSTNFDPSVLFGLADINESDQVFEDLTVDVEIESPDLDKDRIDEWARRAPVYTLISGGQDVNVTVNTPAEVAAGD